MPSTRPKTTALRAEVDCDVSIAVGDLVYFDSNDHCAKIDVNDNLKMPARAIVTKKISSTRALLQFEGTLKDVLTGLTVGGDYFSTNTGISQTPPPGPSRRFIQRVGFAINSSTLIVSFGEPTIKTG